MGCCNRECFAADLAALCPDPKLRHKYFQMIINKHKLDEITATYQGRTGYNMEKLRRALVLLLTWNIFEITGTISDSETFLMVKETASGKDTN